MRDLKDSALRVVPKKYLDVAVGIIRIFGCKVSTRFEHNKPSIAADTSGERFGRGIRELSNEAIYLSPHGEADGKQGYNC